MKWPQHYKSVIDSLQLKLMTAYELVGKRNAFAYTKTLSKVDSVLAGPCLLVRPTMYEMAIIDVYLARTAHLPVLMVARNVTSAVRHAVTV